jgi:hypothetical protein
MSEHKPKSSSKTVMPSKKVAVLPQELKQLVVDTKNYTEKASSTEILQKLRYHAA